MWFEELNIQNAKEVIDRLRAQELEEAQQEEMTKKRALLVADVMDSEGWKYIEEEIENLKRYFIRDPEDYYGQENIVGVIGIDAGARSALTLLTQWLRTQKVLAGDDKNYAESTTRETITPSEPVSENG